MGRLAGAGTACKDSVKLHQKMAIIYHVTSAGEWTRATETGFYTAPSLQSEGFIHCSHENQLEGVLQRYFAGRSDLVKLTLDTDQLSAPVQYDRSPSLNEEFPHVYGPINVNAVIGVEKIA